MLSRALVLSFLVITRQEIGQPERHTACSSYKLANGLSPCSSRISSTPAVKVCLGVASCSRETRRKHVWLRSTSIFSDATWSDGGFALVRVEVEPGRDGL